MSLKYVSGVLEKVEIDKIIEVADLIYKKAYVNGGTVYVAGVGGSAFTASHFVSDLIKYAGDGLIRAVSLTDNIGLVTAVTNDLSWSDVFSWQLRQAKGEDMLIAFSVHGGTKKWSNNLTKAFIDATRMELSRISFTGFDGGEIRKLSHINVNVESTSTPVIEGLHCLLAHLVAEHLRKRISELSK